MTAAGRGVRTDSKASAAATTLLSTAECGQVSASSSGCAARVAEGVSQVTATVGYERETLVWCHERCHKPESVPFRQQLAQAVEDTGARLYCLKKSFGFQQWAHCTKSHFFLLLADWREGQPSADFLIEANYGKPHALVVYTEQEKQYKQALKWASLLPARGYSRHVRVLPPNLSGKELALRAAQLLREGAERMSGETKVQTCSCGIVLAPQAKFCSECGKPQFQVKPTGGEATIACAKLSPQAGADVGSSRAGSAGVDSNAVAAVGAGIGSVCAEPSALVAGVISSSFDFQPFVVVQGLQWTKPVADVLASIFPHATQGDVRSALMSAAPDHYDD